MTDVFTVVKFEHHELLTHPYRQHDEGLKLVLCIYLNQKPPITSWGRISNQYWFHDNSYDFKIYMTVHMIKAYMINFKISILSFKNDCSPFTITSCISRVDPNSAYVFIIYRVVKAVTFCVVATFMRQFSTIANFLFSDRFCDKTKY